VLRCSDDAWLSFTLGLFLHFFEPNDVRRVVLAALVQIGLLLGHVDLRVDIFALELVEQGEGFGLIAVQVLNDVERGFELLRPHLLLYHVHLDLVERVLRVRLHRQTHVHNLFALALLRALVLHLVENLFEVRVLHQPLVGALREFARAVLQPNKVVYQLVLRQGVLQ